MNRFSRTLVLILSLALVIGYFVPIWKIDLEAPQYPEGLGMKIWINKLAGDINTINGLNHYIGMQKIEESSIPELKYMPYLLGIIIGLGLLVATIGKRWLLYTWVFLFAVLGIAGGVDFYMWEYDYGHNLDPRAPIKIPDMYYQPPLFGSKQLLNFIAHSYPDTGGWIILSTGMIAILLVIYNLLKEKKTATVNISDAFKKRAVNPLIIILISTGSLFYSCNSGPSPLQYGKDVCDHCKMKIVDERFGAELVTKQGKIFKFDAIECMVNFNQELDDDKKKKVNVLLVANAAKKGELLEASKAIYLNSENFPSPMGSNISAYADEKQREDFQNEYDGSIMSWEQAKEQILGKKGHVNSHHH